MAYTFKHGDRPLEGYVIQRAVGHGGFGEVYYALSDGGKEVAIKYLRDNPSVELRGVSACLNLKSQHLVNIFDVKQNADGAYFIIMEYVAGPSLRDVLLAAPPQPPLSKGGTGGLGIPKAAFFLREIGKGLSHLHDRGIVHRDLKPGNIFYDDGCVKIGDYGLSKFIAVSRHSVQTASIGTVHYMAPEIGSGHYNQSVDIYALGVILYEMLLGRVPYEGSTMGEVLMKHLMGQPEVAELPAPFPEIIQKSLAKDPADRFASVREMVQAVFSDRALDQSLAGFDVTSLTQLAVRAGREMKPPVSPGAASQGSDNPLGRTDRSPASSEIHGADSTELADTPERRKLRRRGSLLLTLSGVLMFVSAMIPPVTILTGGRMEGEKVAALVVASSAGMAFGISGLVLRIRGRRYRRRGPKLRLPLERSFVCGGCDDLATVIERHFAFLGYKQEHCNGLLWRYRRGSRKTDSWSSCVNRHPTSLNIAAYEVTGGYRIRCRLDIESGWSEWYTQRDLAVLDRELAGFEEMLASPSEWSAANRGTGLRPELETALESDRKSHKVGGA